MRFSAEVEIDDNDLFDNAVGIRLFGECNPESVHDVTISRNRIHDGHSMIVDDPAPDNDFGANAILSFDPTTETFKSYPSDREGAAVRQLLGREGEVWGAESGTDRLVVIRAKGPS